MTIVIDSSAIVAIIRLEPDAPTMAKALADAEGRIMSAATYMECAIVLRKKLGVAGLRALHGLGERMQIAIAPWTAEQADAGIEAYIRFGHGSGHPANLNFGDCFSYALAKTRNLPLLFKGDDFVHTDIEPAVAAG